MQKAPDRQLPEEEGAILPQGGTPPPWLDREWVLGWKSKPIRGGGKPCWSYLNLPRTQPWAVGSSCSPSCPRCPLPVPSTSLLCPGPPMFPLSEKQMSTAAHRPLQPHPLCLLSPLPSLLPPSGLPHWPSAVSGTSQAPTLGPLHFWGPLPGTRCTGPGHSGGCPLVSTTDTFPGHLTLRDNCSLSPAFLPVSLSAPCHSTFPTRCPLDPTRTRVPRGGLHQLLEHRRCSTNTCWKSGSFHPMKPL